MPMHRVVLVLAAAFAVAARPAAGQVYKCVDADGRVTYQQTACARADRGGQAEALRSRVAAERSCEEVLAELGAPAGQEATRVTVGTGGTLRSADALRYTYEPLPNGLPARLSFVCVDGKVVSVARDVAR